MVFTVALVGVHGSGKTTTARLLAVGGGLRLRGLEAIEVAFGLPPVERQTLFLTTYVNSFLSALNTGEAGGLVFDSHPIVVLPYTEYWLARGGLGAGRVREVLGAFERIIALLPPVDLMVYLKADDTSVIVERVRRRARFSAAEEAREDYIEYIDRRLNTLLNHSGNSLARHTLTIPASLEAEERHALIKTWMSENKELVEESWRKPLAGKEKIIVRE